MTIDVATLETRLFINDEFVNSINGKAFDTFNPATANVICSVQEADLDDVDKAVQAARKAFAMGSTWRSMDGSQRRDLLLTLASLIDRDREVLAELESLDNGKPLGSATMYGSRIDVEVCVRHYRYFAGWADKLQGKTIPVDGNFFSYTRREPIGVCACIIPWNFPLIMLAWKLAPALATGNVVIVKPSEKTPLSALYLAKLIQEAGFPPGVVNIVNGFGPTAGEALARHALVDKIAFTGSSSVGHRILQCAAESNLKKVSLELGGKSPIIILDDADLDVAVANAHMGLFLNQGQVCTAASRLFVQEGIYDQFVAAVIERTKQVKMGKYDEDDNIEQGPVVDSLQFQRVMGYIDKGKKEGATVACGGDRHGECGYFIQPTVFLDVTDDMTIAKEEIFGPVMSILKFQTDKEVIERANNTLYGLAAGICSQNGARAISLAHQIRAGTVWINCYHKGDAATPFGGYKESGHGRENGEDSLDNWMEIKCVHMPLIGPKV